MTTRLHHYTLDLKATSAEGPHEFIQVLEAAIEDIKGGIENKEHEEANGRSLEFHIDTVWN